MSAIADGATPYEFKVFLVTQKSKAVQGFLPELKLFGSGEHQTKCSYTDGQGAALCSIVTDKPGDKTITLANVDLKNIASVRFLDARSTVEIPDGEAPANGQDGVVVEVNLTDSEGRPLPGVVPELAIDGDGEYSVVCAPSDAGGKSLCTISSSTPGTHVVRVIEPPIGATGAITFTPPLIMAPTSRADANTSDEAVVQIRTVDGSGQPQAGVVPVLSISGTGTNTYSCEPSNASGYATCRIQSTEAGSKIVQVVSPPISETIQVTFAEAAHEIFGPSASVPADGVSRALVEVLFRDAAHNPLGGVLPELEIQGGQTHWNCQSSETDGKAKCWLTSMTAGVRRVSVQFPPVKETVQVTFHTASIKVVNDGAPAGFDSGITLNIQLGAPGTVPVLDVASPETGEKAEVRCTPANSDGISKCVIVADSSGKYTVNVVSPPTAVSEPTTIVFADENSGIEVVSTSAPADGSSAATFKVILRNGLNLPKIGVTPSVEVVGSGVSNVSCTSSSILGESICSVTTTSYGVKTVRVTSPAVTGSLALSFTDALSSMTAPVATAYVSTPTSHATVRLQLKNSDGSARAGFMPSLGVLGGAGQNTSICSVSDTSGISLCEIRSTAPGGKTVRSIQPPLAQFVALTFLEQDIAAPSVTLASSTAVSTNVNPLPVTITFSEPVIGFDVNDLVIANATVGSFSGSGASYSVSLVPASSEVEVRIGISAGVAQDAAGNPNTASNELVRNVDLIVPVVTIGAISPSGSPSKNISNRTAQMSGAGTSLYKAVIIRSGSCGAADFSSAAETPIASNFSFSVTSDGTYQVCAIGGDEAGNWQLPIAATAAPVVTIDTIAPLVTLASSSATVNGPFNVTATFSEDVADFTSTDVTLVNGTLSAFTGSGSSYSFLVTPVGTGTITVSVGANVAQDAAMNSNLAAADLTRTFDDDPPVLSGLANDSTAAQSKTWSWTCSETCTYRYAITSQPTHVFTIEAYSATATATQSTGDGTYYLHVQAKDSAGNEGMVGHFSAELDNTAPVLTGLADDLTPTQSKSWSWGCAGGPCTYRHVVSTSASHVFSSEGFNSTTSAVQAAGDATFYLHVQARDSLGNVSAVLTVSSVVDNTAPNAHSIFIADENVALTNLSAPDLVLAASGSPAEMYITNVAGCGSGGTWEPFATSKSSWSLDVAQLNGTATVYVKYRDVAGNMSSCVSDSIAHDNVAPATPTLAINTGDSYTTSSDVALALSATGSPTEMYVTNTAGCGAGGIWESYATSRAWTLGQLNASTSVYVRYRDAAGNLSTCASDSITHDNLNPTPPTGITDGAASSSMTSSLAVTFTSGTDATSGVLKHQARVVQSSDSSAISGWIDFTSGSSITGLSLNQNASYKVELRAIDNAGNISTSAVSDGWVADDTPPGVVSGITLGTVPESLSSSPTVSWTVASDGTGGSGVQQYQTRVLRVSDSAVIASWSAQASGASRTGLSLAHNVQYKFEVRAVDIAGNVGSAVTSGNWTAQAPCPVGRTVFDHTGATQSFTVPSGCSSINVRIWGAGGGAHPTRRGGGGGYAAGRVAVTSDEVLEIIVGGRGARTGESGGGGGRSAIRRGTTELITAGGGGGSGGSSNGGSGGGTEGLSAENAGFTGGGGGTQTAGGGAGVASNWIAGGAGSAFAGGPSCGATGTTAFGGGGSASAWGGPGGGGGGYYGGGGGGCGSSGSGTGGGGGSGYLSASVSSGALLQGQGASAVYGGASDSDYGNGVGSGSINNTDGGHGRVVIYYGQAAPGPSMIAAPIAPGTLSLAHTTRNKVFTVSWSEGVNNGTCRIQYLKRPNEGWPWTYYWEDIASATAMNCDANATNASVTMNDSMLSGWNDTEVRLVRNFDNAVLWTFTQKLTCSATTRSASPTPNIDEDCNGEWDNVVTSGTVQQVSGSYCTDGTGRSYIDPGFVDCRSFGTTGLDYRPSNGSACDWGELNGRRRVSLGNWGCNGCGAEYNDWQVYEIGCIGGGYL